MIYTHFVGRVAQNAKIVSGEFGAFVTFDLAVNNYTKGKDNTMFVRLRSKKEHHIKLTEYLTKGKVLLVEGQLNEPTIWTDKNNCQRVQLSVTLDNVQFVQLGKKKDEENPTNAVEMVENPMKEGVKNDIPFEAPADTEHDLPF